MPPGLLRRNGVSFITVNFSDVRRTFGRRVQGRFAVPLIVPRKPESHRTNTPPPPHLRDIEGTYLCIYSNAKFRNSRNQLRPGRRNLHWKNPLKFTEKRHGDFGTPTRCLGHQLCVPSFKGQYISTPETLPLSLRLWSLFHRLRRAL